MIGTFGKTNSGFEFRAFSDAQGRECSVQKAACDDAKRSYLWVGVDTEQMRLNRVQVAKLVQTLQRWLDAGTLRKE